MSKFFRHCLHWAIRRYGAELYELWHKTQNEAAQLSFLKSIHHVGINSRVRHPFYLRGPQHIAIGSNFVAGPGLRLEAWDDYFGAHYEPHIQIGNNVVLNHNVHIGAINSVELHDNVLVGSFVLITDHSHGGASAEEWETPPLRRRLYSKGPTIIERNVWIGEGVCILAGVRIGHNAVVGANAVVTQDVKPNTVVAGVPAKEIARPSS